MTKTITNTEEFFVGSYGEVFTATYEAEKLRGMDAFEAFIKIYSIFPEPHEEDVKTIKDNIIEQVRFHLFKSAEMERESQAEARGDELDRNN